MKFSFFPRMRTRRKIDAAPNEPSAVFALFAHLGQAFASPVSVTPRSTSYVLGVLNILPYRVCLQIYLLLHERVDTPSIAELTIGLLSRFELISALNSISLNACDISSSRVAYMTTLTEYGVSKIALV